MSDSTTIQLDRSVVDSLNKLRESPGQTYDELITHLIKMSESIEKGNQYDEFLHKIQQHKMKELWDNEYDEEWENV